MSYPQLESQQPMLQGPPMQPGQPITGQPMQYGQQPPPMEYGQPQPPMQYSQQQQPMPMQGGGEWMVMPIIQNVPPALAYLSGIDQLMIKQQLEMLEIFTGFETQNKYKIKNVHGQTVFLAAEDSNCCSRWLCGAMRSFEMKIMDNAKNEMMHLYRPLACNHCCCPCSHQTIEVTCPPGTVIGSIEKTWSLMTPKFDVKDETGQTVLKIVGPICTMALCGAVEFEVLSADGTTQIGKISKEWSGLGKEIFSDAENFGISFPMDLDAKIKAVLLGAVFLIDFLYFETKK